MSRLMRACGLIAAVVAGVSPDQSGVAGRAGALHAATPLIRTVAVGGYPTTIAVDQQTARVFVPNAREGTVSMLDAITGRVLRTVQLVSLPSSGTRLSAQWVGVDTRVGHVFVSGVDAMGQGGVSMLDARTGAVLRTVPVGAWPWCLAVDERTARAFVVNQQDRTVSVLDTRSGSIVTTTRVTRLSARSL